MWIFVLLPVLCIVGVFVYTKIILAQMDEKEEVKQQSLTENFISRIHGREAEVKRQYVETNGSVPLAPICNWCIERKYNKNKTLRFKILSRFLRLSIVEASFTLLSLLKTL